MSRSFVLFILEITNVVRNYIWEIWVRPYGILGTFSIFRVWGFYFIIWELSGIYSFWLVSSECDHLWDLDLYLSAYQSRQRNQNFDCHLDETSYTTYAYQQQFPNHRLFLYLQRASTLDSVKPSMKSRNFGPNLGEKPDLDRCFPKIFAVSCSWGQFSFSKFVIEYGSNFTVPSKSLVGSHGVDHILVLNLGLYLHWNYLPTKNFW